jgi:hypothetical protein
MVLAIFSQWNIWDFIARMDRIMFLRNCPWQAQTGSHSRRDRLHIRQLQNDNKLSTSARNFCYNFWTCTQTSVTDSHLYARGDKGSIKIFWHAACPCVPSVEWKHRETQLCSDRKKKSILFRTRYMFRLKGDRNGFYIITVTHSTQHSPFWEANLFAASQEIPHILLNP